MDTNGGIFDKKIRWIVSKGLFQILRPLWPRFTFNVLKHTKLVMRYFNIHFSPSMLQKHCYHHHEASPTECKDGIFHIHHAWKADGDQVLALGTYSGGCFCPSPVGIPYFYDILGRYGGYIAGHTTARFKINITVNQGNY